MATSAPPSQKPYPAGAAAAALAAGVLPGTQGSGIHLGFLSDKKWADPSVRLSAPTMRSLTEVFRFQNMSKVQAATLDDLLRGDDVFAKAKTGACSYARLFPKG